jgi:hypothetical protein
MADQPLLDPKLEFDLWSRGCYQLYYMQISHFQRDGNVYAPSTTALTVPTASLVSIKSVLSE